MDEEMRMKLGRWRNELECWGFTEFRKHFQKVFASKVYSVKKFGIKSVFSDKILCKKQVQCPKWIQWKKFCVQSEFSKKNSHLKCIQRKNRSKIFASRARNSEKPIRTNRSQPATHVIALKWSFRRKLSHKKINYE